MKLRIPIIGLLILIFVLNSVSLFSSQKLAGPDKANFKGAKLYIKASQYDKAIAQFEEVLANNPDNIETLVLIADVYFFYKALNYVEVKDKIEFSENDIENMKKAREYYQKASEEIEKPENQPKKEKHKKKFEEKKTTVINNLSSINTKIFNTILARYKEQKYDDAIDYGNYLIENYPKHKNEINTFKMLALAYGKKEDNENQLKYIELMRSNDPKDAWSRNQLVDMYTDSENFVEAEKLYNELIEIEPDNSNHLYNLAWTQYSQGNKQEAINNYKKFVELNPDDSETIELLANLYFDNKNLKEALVYYKMAVEKNPESKEAISSICYTANQLEDWATVIEYGEMWYSKDNTAKDAVQFVMIGASKTNNKDLYNKYNEYYKKMN